ncbi:iron-containing alcohol dehydrogenase [uncultured Planococcus sp.]|uniref:iron-containing alcohol dehydrogenase n=1 Tax=uncultured Planococcus sp. TaxID=337815 RepID=UPI00263643E3|nr:iron-containing alcohol dehydrogenase [uncultured Planococcus sp.]
MVITNEKLNISDFRMPTNFKFGCGAHKSLPEEIQKYSPKKIAIVSDKGVAQAGIVDKLKKVLKSTDVPIYTFTDISGEPTFKLVKNVTKKLQEENVDLVIGVGGGSALDVAKASAALLLTEDVDLYLSGTQQIGKRQTPCILVPTTSGTGSEVTMNAIFGDEEKELKRGIVSPALLPDLAIIDPGLTISCPPRVSASSGIDAFTHAIESYISVKATPLTKIFAEKAMRLFPEYITSAVHNGSNLEARTGMSWVSALAGVSLANGGVGAVHALAYPLGGKYHIEHGVANALLMPYVFNKIGTTCTREMVEVASFLQLGDYSSQPREALPSVVQYLFELLDTLNLPKNLKDLDIPEIALAELAESASKVERLLANTPYKLSERMIKEIYENAYHGKVGVNGK